MAGDAREEVRSAVHRLVLASGGQVIRRPMFRDRPDFDWQRDEPEPLAGIRAAVSLQHEVGRAIAECARFAREDGVPWGEIGESLIPGDPPGEGTSKASAAFERLAWSGDPWRASSFTWTCPACLQRISDHGPEAGHPSDTEEGHADGCQRHAADIATWNAQWEDE